MNVEIANLFTNMMSLSNPDQLFDMNFSFLQDLPFHLYWKDRAGKYQGSNHCQAQDAGFEKGEDLLGLTDQDLSWKKEAAKLRHNDAKVMKSEKIIIFSEDATIVDDNFIKGISYKAPVRLRSNKIVGVMGLSMIVRENIGLQADTLLIETGVRITKRQNECLYYLVKGMTMKQIAAALKLSPRTIEHYIENLKIKFDCSSRIDLIAKALQLHQIKDRL